MIRRNTSDVIDHPLSEDYVFEHWVSHHAWAPGPII